ncbi:PhnD/SsuA/transferrin family substrate-binding protein [Bradyrhizobium sp. dw_78]|uniref:ABC transporter substrate-binding protein n=1 Tax=Bradyrhizobium sp. dw_78 TaxID=2719793 RepID=UPI001BD1DEE7|nr:PhnD/SsuA/transferrin family substrate-binding protein [Bradyrhizobium sp. dw_78]
MTHKSKRSSVFRSPSRREVLAGITALAASPFVVTAAAAASKPVVNVTLSTPGSAGSIWRAAISTLDPSLSSEFDIRWVAGDPGQMQVQLAAGSLDVGLFGAIGLASLARRGSDITLFGPGLNNHGRIIVQADSPYQKPSDLVGKKIATQPKTTETYQQARVALSLIGIDMERDFEVFFGPPTANLALFDRGDVDAIIVVEPTATRAVGAGARELAKIGEIWRQSSGVSAAPFLVGLAAKNSWIASNRHIATSVARLFAAANGALRRNPELFVEYASEMGLRQKESTAIELLPSRLADVYPTDWDQDVWNSIDRQIEIAVKVGLLDATPERPLYDGLPLGKA